MPTVGCISAVNSRVGEFGLQKRGFLPPLVAEGRMEKSDQSKDDKKKVLAPCVCIHCMFS